MIQSIEDRIEALEAMGLDELRDVWRANYGPPPPLRSKDLLRFMIAWRIQCAAYGGLDPETKRALKRTAPIQPEGMEMGVGTKFQRVWNGRTVEVEVTDAGFQHDGQTYKSLSAAATAIAGTRWNGPRFFGLRETRP